MEAFKELATFWYIFGWVMVFVLFFVVVYKSVRYFQKKKDTDD